MRDLSWFGKMYIAVQPVDFRKQAHGLALIVAESFQISPHKEKSLFIFTNKRKNAAKLLYWDFSGYAMWWKTLENERFKWPKADEATMVIKAKELRWLLDGIDIDNIKTHKKIEI